MKISKQTEQMMVLDYRPIFFAFIFGTVSFLTFAWGVLDFQNDGMIKIIVSSIFMLALLALVERARLTMHATNASVVLKKKTAFGLKHLRFEMSEVSHFDVEENRNSDGANTERMFMIVTGDQAEGRYYLTDTSYTASLDNVAKEANRWLDRQKGRRDASAL